MKSVAIAGSTGSIGKQAIEVIQANPDRFELLAIGANSSVDTLVQQATELHPQVVAIADASLVHELQSRVPEGVEVRGGADALASLTLEAEIVVNAVVGFAGLPVTLEALGQGRRLALANKESLVAGGELVAKARNTPGAELLPIDSEHGALHQCLQAEGPMATGRSVNKLVLTASGGPFLGKTTAELQTVGVEQALAHPTWKMGPKITIDSSTLFNKGLEVIEAHELFGIDYDHIEVVVHPQSIVHSAVEFSDGSTIAQLSHPDMRLPIGYAMGYPERMSTPFGALNWSQISDLTFQEPDTETFRCLGLAYAAGRSGGTAPTWLNAANEVAVQAFLEGKITWIDIAEVVEASLDSWDGVFAGSVEEVIEADSKSRNAANEYIRRAR
jgi:1-deoxy-D-xylulose-5-phosphate reductoisomerase